MHGVSGLINPVMWSLVVEVQFYIVLPLIFYALRRVPVRVALWTAFLLLLVVPTAFRWWNASHGIFQTLHPEIRLNFPSALDAFAFGVLLAGFENLGWVRKSWARFGDLGCVLLVLFFPIASWVSLMPVLPLPVQTERLGWYVEIVGA